MNAALPTHITMQTSFSHRPNFPELFTRERRQNRLHQFLADFERSAFHGISRVPDLLPVKIADETSAKSSASWTQHASR